MSDPVRPELLRALVAVADSGGFSAAARQLGLRQSTVSQQIKQLEATTGRRLLDRDTHRVALTPQGELVLEHARRVLDANAALHRHLQGTPLRGRLRVGASEDFVLSALPDVLAGFIRRYPEVDLALTAGLSHDLYEAYDGGRLDLVFVKRRAGDRRGMTAWREQLAWVGRAEFRVAADAPLPLLLYPPPSVTRVLALETLERARRPSRIAFTSASLTGLSAAARAGVGLMPHSRRLMPAGLAAIAPGPALPPLPEIEFVVVGSGGSAAAETLQAEMLQWAASGRTMR